MLRHFTLSLLLLSAVILRAQDDELKVTAGLDWASRLIVQGVELSGPTTLAAVHAGQNGFHADLETGWAGRASEPDFSSLRIGHDRAWREGGPTLGVEAVQQWFTGLRTGATKSTTSVGVSAAWQVPGGLTPRLAWWHEFRRRSETVEFSVGYEWPLTRIGTYLEAELVAGTVSAGDLSPDATGAAIRDSFGYGAVRIRLPYRIGAHSTLIAGAELNDRAGQNAAWSPIHKAVGLSAGVRFGVNIDF